MQIKNLTIFASLVLVAMLAISIATIPTMEAAFATSFSIGSNSVFISDQGNNSVKLVDVSTGKYGGVFIPSSDDQETYNILGPRGIISHGSTLLLANQKVNTNSAGEIDKFDASTGSFQGALVPSSDPNAPFVPRGIVLSPDGKFLYVADAVSSDGSHGFIRKYDANTGEFKGKFSAEASLFARGDEFFPRGLVFGPDGKLYVSVFEQPIGDSLAGYIMTFDPSRNTFKVVVAGNANNGLHRPEGLVFSPDGKTIWVTGFRADSSDTDKLLAFSPNGQKKSEIVLQKGSAREFAQALLFGPGSKLFVPITSTGELRSYDTSTSSHPYTVIVRASGPLKEPWYLSFRGTNPSTLAY
jgi:DNA-binding beta-propeller fold protein YncE